jgi:hypothetical protein
MQFTIADGTGSCTFSVFGTLGGLLRVEDIVRISGAYGRLFKNNLSVAMDKHNSRVEKVGEFTMVFKQFPNYSGWNWYEDATPGGGLVSLGDLEYRI